MHGVETFREIARRLLAHAPADEAEALFLGTDEELTRFANNEIHQSVAETNVEVRVRVVQGGRVGVATTNALDEAALEEVTQRALRLAEASPVVDDWPGLPTPDSAPPDVPGFEPATAGASPRRRAEAVERVTQAAHRAGCVASGALSTRARETVVVNSHGLFLYYPHTDAQFVTVVMSEEGGGSGYAAGSHKDFNHLDVGGLGEEALERALASREPRDVEPGEWDVVLDPYAVADMVAFLGRLGLNGAALVEHRSFGTGRMDERVTGENVTITDNGQDPDTLPLPFDYEGTTRQPLTLIDRGVLRNVTWDRLWAARGGATSTGHALPAPESWGPMPLHLQMAAGDTPRAELVRGMKRGLLVTRFNYTRPVHPLKTIVTGLTRDGTFLVENGEIVGPVKNLRFTESYLDAFSRIEAISQERQLLDMRLGSVLAPAVRLRGFTFTGTTQF